MLSLPLTARINQPQAAAEEETPVTPCGLSASLKSAYHPRFAAEVVDGEERVDTWDSTKVQTDHEVPEVLTWDHTVGVLTDQDKVRLNGPAERRGQKRFIRQWVV